MLQSNDLVLYTNARHQKRRRIMGGQGPPEDCLYGQCGSIAIYTDRLTWCCIQTPCINSGEEH
jgi:hypothetical protein